MEDIKKICFMLDIINEEDINWICNPLGQRLVWTDPDGKNHNIFLPFACTTASLCEVDDCYNYLNQLYHIISYESDWMIKLNAYTRNRMCSSEVDPYKIAALCYNITHKYGTRRIIMADRLFFKWFYSFNERKPDNEDDNKAIFRVITEVIRLPGENYKAFKMKAFLVPNNDPDFDLKKDAAIKICEIVDCIAYNHKEFANIIIDYINRKLMGFNNPTNNNYECRLLQIAKFMKNLEDKVDTTSLNEVKQTSFICIKNKEYNIYELKEKYNG